MANSTTFTDTVPFIGTYLYRVRAENSSGNSVFTDPVSSLITEIMANDHTPPANYGLEQNYPNPFNPITIIKYSIAEEGNVRLSVFNLLGCKVHTLVDEKKSAGNYSVQLDGSNLPTGLYFYRLETNRYSATKKLLLLK